MSESSDRAERFTRGPWLLSEEDVDDETWFGRPLKAPSAADRNCGHPQVVAVIVDIVSGPDGGGCGDETSANAHLLKASPLLYDFVQWLWEMATDGRDSFTQDTIQEIANEAWRLMKLARGER